MAVCAAVGFCWKLFQISCFGSLRREFLARKRQSSPPHIELTSGFGGGIPSPLWKLGLLYRMIQKEGFGVGGDSLLRASRQEA